MRAGSVLSLLSLSLLAACGNERGGRGYVVVVARDANLNDGRDAGDVEGREDGAINNPNDAGDDPERDGGGGIVDANPQPDAMGFEDAWSPPDVGFEDAQVFPDASPPDTGRPDAGQQDATIWDIGWPDFGFPDTGVSDAGRPDTGQTDSGVPPAFQTTVSVVTPSQITLNLVPPVPADPLTYSVELSYDNIGPGSQNISITNVDVTAIVVPVQTFLAGPAHNAPVGASSRTVTKTPGTGSMISNAAAVCMLPIAIVTIDFSNGQQLQDFGTITCLQ